MNKNQDKNKGTKKKNNVEENLADLVLAFQKKKELSVKDIMDLLSCNRQSVYNYINRLKDRGLNIDSETRNRLSYYILNPADGSAVTEHYIQFSNDILRRYAVIQQLHKSALSPDQLYKLFLLSRDEEEQDESTKPDTDMEQPSDKKQRSAENLNTDKNPDPSEDPTYKLDKIPLDIAQSTFTNLIDKLDRDDEIRLEADGAYHATGRMIPLLHHFTDEELFILLDQLKTLPEGSPYHSQLQSIAKKLEILEASYDMSEVSSSNYLTYGKKHDVLSQISHSMRQLAKTNYREELIRVKYRPRTGDNEERKVLFQVGMVVYSVEKAALYLFGKEFTEDPVLAPVSDSIIEFSTIISLEDADNGNGKKEEKEDQKEKKDQKKKKDQKPKYPNNSYHSTEFQNIFSEMFSISMDTPVDVTVRFDLTANVKRKIQYLKDQRSNASITFFPEENQLEYTDTIRGLNDFANYLRQFGRSVHVIAPEELKQKMAVSVIRTLARYEEEDHE